MILDNTGFNVDYWARFSEDEFIKENMKSGTFGQYQKDDRIILLKFAYKQIKGDAPRDAEAVVRVQST